MAKGDFELTKEDGTKVHASRLNGKKGESVDEMKARLAKDGWNTDTMKPEDIKHHEDGNFITSPSYDSPKKMKARDRRAKAKANKQKGADDKAESSEKEDDAPKAEEEKTPPVTEKEIPD